MNLLGIVVILLFVSIPWTVAFFAPWSIRWIVWAKTGIARPLLSYFSPVIFVLVYLAIAAIGLTDYPTILTRNFRHRMDTRIIEGILGEPLPASFQLLDSHVPYNDPFLDGPSAACYRIHISASDLAEMKLMRQWEAVELNKWNHRIIEALNHFHQEVSLTSWGSESDSDRQMRWEIYSISKAQEPRSFGNLVIDKGSSSTLTLYLATTDPYRDN